MSKAILVPACLAASLLASATVTSVDAAPLVVGNTKYVVRGLVGVGRLPASLRDEHGETFGSISGLYADASSWSRNGDTYTGTFYATPDRGYNVAGTIDYQPRINRLGVSFTPVGTSGKGFAQDQIQLTLEQAQKLFEALPGVGPRALSGLDPVPGGVATGGARAATATLPELPQAFNGKLSLDAEGIVTLADGSRVDQRRVRTLDLSLRGRWPIHRRLAGRRIRATHRGTACTTTARTTRLQASPCRYPPTR